MLGAMVLVAFRSPERARLVGGQFARHVAVHSIDDALRVARACVLRAVVLDVYVGTSGRRSIDAIPEFAPLAPVIFAVRDITPATVETALALGAAGVVSRYATDMAARVSDALARYEARVASGAAVRLPRAHALH